MIRFSTMRGGKGRLITVSRPSLRELDLCSSRRLPRRFVICAERGCCQIYVVDLVTAASAINVLAQASGHGHEDFSRVYECKMGAGSCGRRPSYPNVMPMPFAINRPIQIRGNGGQRSKMLDLCGAWFPDLITLK